MMPSWPGQYRYDPCDRCGYATRFKQFPMVCACTTPDRCPHPIAVSEAYETKASAQNGVASVQKNAADATVVT
jgi:hypothetical protein